MNPNTVPLKYRRKSSPPPSPRMLSPIAPFSSSFISPPPKWIDSDDDLDPEPALTSDDALTVLSSSCSRAPSLAPLDGEDAHVDIVSSPVRETFFRAHQSSRAPLQRYNKSFHPNPKSSATREDVAAALLALHAQPRLGPSQPLLAHTSTQAEAKLPPPSARRTRVVTPSLRNLVLPRTPSPPPRSSSLLTTPSLIDHDSVHATAPSARRTPSPTRRATPASSPLPPSSPIAEEVDCETSEPSAFHSVPCSKPKSESLQFPTPILHHAHTRSEDSDADEPAPPWSRDDAPKEECDHSLLLEHEVLGTASSEDSPFTAVAPNERYPTHERNPSAPPFIPLIPELSVAKSLESESGDQHGIHLPIPDDQNRAPQLHGSRPETPIRAVPSSSPSARASEVPQSDSPPPPDTADRDAIAVPPPPPAYSRAASSALTPLADEHSTPPSPPHDTYPTSSPLSSPPALPSPAPEKHHRQTEPPLPAVGVNNSHAPPTLLPESESDPDIASASASMSASAQPERGSKRRRRDSDADDKPWRDRKKQQLRISTPTPPPALLAQPLSASSSTHPSLSTSPPSASSSSTTTTTTTTFPSIFTSASTPSSPTTDDLNPDDRKKDHNRDNNPNDPSADDDDDDDHQPCPHPALLGTLIEALALSRASSLTLSTLTRTNPELAGYPQAVLTATLAWAVRAHILGCVRSSGEALPPSYFYDPAEDPDRERGELLRCLMPRAGKRRETMKYKQYYWAPVVVGRGPTRTWDVDWDE